MSFEEVKTDTVFDRLASVTISRNEIDLLRSKLKDKLELEECTFKPNISKGTNEMERLRSSSNEVVFNQVLKMTIILAQIKC